MSRKPSLIAIPLIFWMASFSYAQASEDAITVQIYPKAPPSSHSIVPFIDYVRDSNEFVKQNYITAGVEYRFRPDLGYNCKISYQVNNVNKHNFRHHFNFWNAYRFTTPFDTVSYGIFNIHSFTEAYNLIGLEYRGMHANELGLGFGVEKTLPGIATFGLEVVLNRDISRFGIYRRSYNHVCWAWHLKKTSSFEISLPIQKSVHDKVKLEFTPYFKKTTDSEIYRKGARLSVMINV